MQENFRFEPDTARKAGLSKPVMLALAVAVLVLAALATWWFTRTDDGSPSSPLFNIRSEEPADTTDAAPRPDAAPAPRPAATAGEQAVAEDARQAVERVEAVVEQQGGLDSRVAAMEQRLTRLDLQLQEAEGNTGRAEGLLIAFAARRSIERGEPLGYLTDQLRLRFGDARPNAVQVIIDASRTPVTLDQLLARLEGLAETLTQSPTSEGMLSTVKRELSQLFVVRRDDTPSPAAERRLERARMFLQSGRIEAAVAEVRQLPNPEVAGDWIIDAERFAGAQRALEVLETAAVLDPRDLRDGSGTRVRQPSAAAQ